MTILVTPTYGPLGSRATLLPRVIAPAVDHRIELAEAKSFCVVDHEDDDADLQSMIDTAFAWLQPPAGVLAKSIAKQTLRIDLPYWPLLSLELPAGPVQAVTSITYFDLTNVEQTLPSDQYFVDYDTLVWNSLKFLAPTLYQARPSNVRITYETGLSDELFENSGLRGAMVRIIKHLYDYREELNVGMSFDPDAFGVGDLIMPWRLR